MGLAVAFGTVLLVAVLVSSWAHRSAMSLPLLFLVVGVAVGDWGFGLVPVDAGGGLVSRVVEVALFTVLFTDGMRALVRPSGTSWRPPAMALLIGMPATAAVIAILTWALTDLPLAAALLLGVVLSPTDPVLVAALVRRDEVPRSLRHTLNVESGVNDGLALPGVVVLVAVLGGADTPSPWLLVAELAGGVLLGACCAAVVGLLVRLPVLAVHRSYLPLAAAALAVAVYGASHLLHVNHFLAAFVAGATLQKAAPELCSAFRRLGEQASELMKFFALLVFGALLTPGMLADLPAGGYLVAVLALLVARPASLMLSFMYTGLPVRERLVAAWFGPKGLASVLYGVYVLQSAVPWAEQVFAITALAVTLSVLVHTTTDAPVARRLRARQPAEGGEDRS